MSVKPKEKNPDYDKRVTINTRLFKELSAQLASDDAEGYVDAAEKLTKWLKSDKAYYVEARAQIVAMLEIAAFTLARPLVLTPNQPFHVTLCPSTLQKQAAAYTSLIHVVQPHFQQFPEDNLKSRLINVFSTIYVSPSGQPPVTSASSSQPSSAVSLDPSGTPSKRRHTFTAQSIDTTYSSRTETSAAQVVPNPEPSARATPASMPQESLPKPSSQQGVSHTLGHDSNSKLSTPKASSRSRGYTLSKASWTERSSAPSPSPSEESLLSGTSHTKDIPRTDKLSAVLPETTTTSAAVSNHSPTPQPAGPPNVMQPSHAPDPSQMPQVTPRLERSTPPASSSQSIDQATPQQSSAPPTVSTNAPSPSKDAKTATSKILSFPAKFLQLAALDRKSYKRQSQSKTATVQSPEEAGGGSARTDTVTTATSDQGVVKPGLPPVGGNPPESIPEGGTVECTARSAHSHPDPPSAQNAELPSPTPSAAVDPNGNKQQRDTPPASAHSLSRVGSQSSDTCRPGTQQVDEEARVPDAVPITQPSFAGGNVERNDTSTSETPPHSTFREVPVTSDISVAGAHRINGAIPVVRDMSREASLQPLSYAPNLDAPMLGTEPCGSGSLPSRIRDASEPGLPLFDSTRMSQRPSSVDNDKDPGLAMPKTDGVDLALDVVQDSVPVTSLPGTEAQLTSEDLAASQQNTDTHLAVPALGMGSEPRSRDMPTSVSGDVTEKAAGVDSPERSEEIDVIVSSRQEPCVADSLAPAADNQDVIMLEPSQSAPTSNDAEADGRAPGTSLPQETVDTVSPVVASPHLTPCIVKPNSFVAPSASIGGGSRLATLAQHILHVHGDEDKQERVPHLIQHILAKFDVRFSSLPKEDLLRIFEAAKAARATSLSNCQSDAGPGPGVDVPGEVHKPNTAMRTEETLTTPLEPHSIGTAAGPGDVAMSMAPENLRKHRRGSSDDKTSGRPVFRQRGDSPSSTDLPPTENDMSGIETVALRRTSVETEGYPALASTDDSQLAGEIVKSLSGSTLQADASVLGSLDPAPSSQKDAPDAAFREMAPAIVTTANIPVPPRLNYHPTPPFQILKFIDGSSTPDVRDVQFELDDAHAALVKRWNDRYDVFDEKAPCISITLICTLVAQVQAWTERNPGASAEEATMSMEIKWPNDGGIWIAIESGDSASKSLTVSPPLFVKRHEPLDLSAFVVAGTTKIQFTRVTDSSKYLFTLRAHRPTEAQLTVLHDARREAQAWQETLAHVSAPFPPSLHRGVFSTHVPSAL